MSVLAIDLGKTNCRVTIGDHGACLLYTSDAADE